MSVKWYFHIVIDMALYRNKAPVAATAKKGRWIDRELYELWKPLPRL